MKKLLLLFLLVNIHIQAQINTKVYGIELDSIQKWAQKKPKFFKYLERKFQKTDLPQDELILLYYGSAFLKDYQPQKANKEVEILSKYIGQMDFESALKTGESLIPKYPVEARLYMLTGYAAKKLGNEKKSKFYYKKYADLVRVAMYSGNGNSFNTAYIVRSSSDEFLIINQKNLEVLRMEVRYNNKRPFDKMILAPKSDKNKKQEIYFNIYLPFLISKHKTFKDIQNEAIIKFKIDTNKNKNK